MKYYIYKLFNKNKDLLYIGKTKYINNRIHQHKRDKEWREEIDNVYYAECLNEADMNIYEVYYINKLNPKYNKSENYNISTTFDIKDLFFKQYKTENILELKNITDSDLGKLFRLFLNYEFNVFNFEDLKKVLIQDNNKTLSNFISRIISTNYLTRNNKNSYKINKDIIQIR